MNRRNCLKLLAGLLPCALAARMLGEKDLHGTPSPFPHEIPPYAAISGGIPPFVPTSGFHVEVRELGERWSEWEGKVERTPPCFRATMRDCSGNHSICAIQSPFFEIGETDNRRRALDFLYKNIGEVIRRRQFPKDTLIYDTEVTANGVKLMNPRYPK